MIPTVIPEHNLPFIDLRVGRAVVSRYLKPSERFVYTSQPALNWEALEADAIRQIGDMVGSPEDGHYPCPPELAARAEWPPADR